MDQVRGVQVSGLYRAEGLELRVFSVVIMGVYRDPEQSLVSLYAYGVPIWASHHQNLRVRRPRT